MKHFQISLCLSLILSLPLSIFAQDPSVGIKIYPLSLISGKVAIQGEYMLNDNQSLTLDLSRRGISLDKGPIGNLITNNVNEPISGDYSSFQIAPSFRRYSKKKEGPRGGYFSPGLRYASTNIDLIMDIEDYPGTAVSVSTNMVGINLDFGAQWLIGEVVSIDWNIIGLGLQYGTVKGTVGSASLSPADAEQLARKLNEQVKDVPLVNISFKAEGNTVSTNSNLILPVLRSRLSIGVFF